MKKVVTSFLCGAMVLTVMPTNFSANDEIMIQEEAVITSEKEIPSVPAEPRTEVEDDWGIQEGTYSYERMLQDIALLQEKYSFLDIEVLTDETRGDEAYKIKLGKGKKSVLVTNDYVAKDWSTTQYTMQTLARYAQAYANSQIIDGQDIRQALDTVSMVFIPATTTDVSESIKISMMRVSQLNQKFRHDYIKTNTERRGGAALVGPKFIVAHDTGNNNATAKNNVDYYKRSANDVSASAHIFVDDKESVLTIPLTEKAWHVRYNVTTDNNMFGYNANDAAIGVELCYFSGNRTRSLAAYKNYVNVLAYLCKTYHLDPQTDIVSHQLLDPSRRTDPTNALKRIGKTYNTLINDVTKATGRLAIPFLVLNEMENENYVYNLVFSNDEGSQFIWNKKSNTAYKTMYQIATDVSAGLGYALTTSTDERYLLQGKGNKYVPQLKVGISNTGILYDETTQTYLPEDLIGLQVLSRLQ